MHGRGLQRHILIGPHIINCDPDPASAFQECCDALQIIVGHVGPVELAAAAIGESGTVLTSCCLGDLSTGAQLRHAEKCNGVDLISQHSAGVQASPFSTCCSIFY